MVKSETINEPRKITLSGSVNETYSNIAKELLAGNKSACCEGEQVRTTTESSCCGDDEGVIELKDLSQNIPTLGSDKDLMGFAKPQEGETVVDLGSGPGRDALNFAREVGETGHVIGIDFSDDMLKLANKNASESEIPNVEFRKGSIEDIPVDAETADLIISNCVVNLADNRENVFASSYKILKEGGRIVFSDLVVKDTPSEELTSNVDAVCGCYAGTTKQNYIQMLKAAGFKDVKAIDEYEFTKNFGGSEIEYSSSIFQGVK
ncbi:MAG: methyltransferase domain-containing protein [Candidatus Heimdallarchaeota archaeon]|nr:methyltransferase domain-containing protein [Candidatus Heimdallarchaeota archaeon]